MNQIIEVIVAPSGVTRFQTIGFTGNRCQVASRFLEAALGSRVHEERTAEYYQITEVGERVHEAGDH